LTRSRIYKKGQPVLNRLPYAAQKADRSRRPVSFYV
jgi:hypothetical protein